MRPSTSYTHSRRKAHSFFAASRKLSKGKGKGKGKNRAERQKIGAGKIEKENKKRERYGKIGEIDGRKERGFYPSMMTA